MLGISTVLNKLVTILSFGKKCLLGNGYSPFALATYIFLSCPLSISLAILFIVSSPLPTDIALNTSEDSLGNILI